MHILVTRPVGVAQRLCEKINAIGAIALPFPTIEIHKHPDEILFQTGIDTLATTDIAIFVSRHAVQFALPAIQQRWNPLPPVLWTAIGPGTAEALNAHGIQNVFWPPAPPYESESLLATKTFQAVAGKRVIIFRGNGGRPLLSRALQERGAIVQIVEVYQRSLPTTNIETYPSLRHTSIDVIVTTSVECLNNLMLLGGERLAELKEIPLIVVGKRMCERAIQLEFKRTLVAAGADDNAIMDVVMKFKDSR